MLPADVSLGVVLYIDPKIDGVTKGGDERGGVFGWLEEDETI